MEATQPLEDYLFNCVVMAIFLGFYHQKLIWQIPKLIELFLGSPFRLFPEIMK